MGNACGMTKNPFWLKVLRSRYLLCIENGYKIVQIQMDFGIF